MSEHHEEEASEQPLNPLEMTQALMQMGMRLQNLMQAQNSLEDDSFLSHFQHVAHFYGEAASKLMYNPQKMALATQEYMDGVAALGKKMVEFGTSLESAQDSIIHPASNDRRFKNDLWQKNPFFDGLKQSYLLWNQWMRKASQSVEGLNEKESHKFDFYTRQVADFFSPSNFLWTNPQALQKIIDTKGMSLFKGMENFIKDLEQGKGSLDIKMVDHQAFKLGVNVATTPGNVIFQNELIQLIHYVPLTPQVHQRPLLLIPPCINKYYIFDMRESNSFVKWCLDKGLQVFVISWVNPTEKLASKSLEDYIFEGVGEAVRVVQEVTHSPTINGLGFCIGGTFLSIYAAYQAAKGKEVFASLTYLATLFDFQRAGDLKVFLDEKQLDDIEKLVKKKGMLEGKVLARTFNLLRANDLIWWFVINNYLLGEEPAAFDLLYWNSDYTNLPSKMYIYYLREIFFKNRLMNADGDGLPMRDIHINLSASQTPTYIFNTRDDHIAPWHAGYAGLEIFKSRTKFVLGDSGHIAGVFNHPKAQKYRYWTLDTYPQEPEQWLEQAQAQSGSWWEDWMSWLKPYLGPSISLEEALPNSSKKPRFTVLESAPGSYALKKGAA